MGENVEDMSLDVFFITMKTRSQRDTGSTVVQVAYEQLRSACGLEEWSPSRDDIRVLRDGAV